MDNKKQLFKDVYNEDPATFKQSFEQGIKQKIFNKIEAKKQEIVDSINNLVEPQKETPDAEKTKEE